MKKALTIDARIARIAASRAEIDRLQRQMVEDRIAINDTVERVFPNSGRLTERQRQVLGLVRKRLCNKEIASALNISVRTVKFHVSSLLAIFGKTDRYDLMDVVESGEGK